MKKASVLKIVPPTGSLASSKSPMPAWQSQLAHALAGRYRFVPVLIAILCIWLVFYFANERFLTPRNLTNLSVQIVVTSLLALGLVLVLVIREIDLSIAALSAVSAGVMGYLLVDQGLSAWAAVPTALLTGSAVGFLQGIIITRFRSPAFIVTLGTSLAMQGALLILLPRSGSIPLAGTSVQWIANSFMSHETGYAFVLLAAVLLMILLLPHPSRS